MKNYYFALLLFLPVFFKKTGLKILSYPELVNSYYETVKKLNSSVIPDSFILAVIFTESAGDNKAIGDNGKSLGLMQLQFGAWIDSGVPYEYNKTNAFNPEKNILAGCNYLQFLYNLTGDIDKAIMSYNVGIGNLNSGSEKWQKRAENYLSTVRKHRNKILPYLIG